MGPGVCKLLNVATQTPSVSAIVPLSENHIQYPAKCNYCEISRLCNGVDMLSPMTTKNAFFTAFNGTHPRKNILIA